jgi:hypothetical protein
VSGARATVGNTTQPIFAGCPVLYQYKEFL